MVARSPADILLLHCLLVVKRPMVWAIRWLTGWNCNPANSYQVKKKGRYRADDEWQQRSFSIFAEVRPCAATQVMSSKLWFQTLKREPPYGPVGTENVRKKNEERPMQQVTSHMTWAGDLKCHALLAQHWEPADSTAAVKVKILHRAPSKYNALRLSWWQSFLLIKKNPSTIIPFFKDTVKKNFHLNYRGFLGYYPTNWSPQLNTQFYWNFYPIICKNFLIKPTNYHII